MNTPILSQDQAASTDAANAIVGSAALEALVSPFKNQRIGSFELIYVQDGASIKPKKSDGYVSLRLRGRAKEVGYFIVVSDNALPSPRAMHQQIEQFYGRQKDTRVSQVHLEARLLYRQ